MDTKNITQKDLYALIRHVTTDIENRDDCFYQFLKFFWGTVVTDKLRDNWHVEYLCSELQKWCTSVIKREQKDHDMIINISPGESKSTICSVLMPAWVWSIDPSVVFLTVSYNIDLAIALAVKHKDVINSSLYKSVYGTKVRVRDDMDSKFYFMNTAGGFRFSSAVGAKLTGFHGHIKIMDDPNNPFEQFNPDLYYKDAAWYDTVYRSRNKEESITKELLVQQRCAPNDMTAHILSKEKKKVHHICLPATIKYDVKPKELIKNYKNGLMNPNRRDWEILAQIEDDVGEYIFDTQYGQDAKAVGGGIVQKEDIEVVNSADLPVDFWSEPVYTIVDSAQKDGKRSDPSGIMVAVEHYNDLYILDYVNERLNFHTLKNKIEDVFRRYSGSIYTGMIVVEEASSGYAIVDELRMTTPLNIYGYPKPQDTKYARFMSNQNIFRGKRVKVVHDGFAGHLWNKKFIDKLCNYPNVKNDEEIDCINMAIEILLKGKRNDDDRRGRQVYTYD